MMNRRVSFLVAAAVCCAAPAVHAESRAWTAAKKVLPGSLQVVAGINVAAVKTSALYQQFMPLAMAQAGDAKDHLAKIKTTCGIDFTVAIDSLVMAMQADEKGAVVVALKGATESQLEACGQKIAAADKKKLVITKDGAFMKYSGLGDKDVEVKWVGKDTFVIATVADDASLLTAMTAGGLAKDKTLSPAISAVNTAAGVWVVVEKSQDLPGMNAKMSGAYGSADVKSGTIDVDAHFVLDSAKAATDAAVKSTSQLEDAKKAGQIPPMLAGLVKTIAIKAAGSEMVITAALPEKDVLTLLTMFGAH